MSVELNRCPHCGGILLPLTWENGSESTVHGLNKEAEACLLRRLGMQLPEFKRFTPANPNGS